MPRTGVGALSFGSSAHAVSMRFALLPATAVRAPVVKVKSAPVHVGLGGGRRARGTGGGRGGHYSPVAHLPTRASVHLVRLLHTSQFIFTLNDFT